MLHFSMFLSLFLVIIIAILLFMYNGERKKIVRLKQKNKEILSANLKLSELNNCVREQNSTISKENERLEIRDSNKNRLFAIISHDVREPVKSIQGIIGLLKSDKLTKAELNSLVDDCSMNVSNVSSFLDNILSWAYGQLNTIAPAFVEIDLKQLLQENIDLLKCNAEQKSISLINSVRTSVKCFSDVDMINLVIRNFLSNAIKFTPVNGEVLLGVELAFDKVKVYVKDDGIGIPSDVSAQLFGLKHVTTNGTMNEKGTGLGLVVCKDFIEKVGGEIGVNSKEGKGSEFYFTLPEKTNV